MITANTYGMTQAIVDYYTATSPEAVGYKINYKLADCSPVQKPCETAPIAKGCWGNKKKDESPMNYASATVISQDTTEKDQRRYLIRQLDDAYQMAKSTLQHKFGLVDDDAPLTITDTVKRITDGLFVIPEKYKDQKVYGSLAYLRWRDPKAVEDKAGYELAKDALKKSRLAAERTITVLTLTEGLKALEDFENTVTAPAKSPKA